jgi:hypothetical protein
MIFFTGNRLVDFGTQEPTRRSAAANLLIGAFSESA